MSSTGSRPPPSKSTTANTIGGLGDQASRSTVKVTTVPVASAIGSGSEPGPGFGGSCTSPSSLRLPTKPYFHSSLRAAADDDTRAGSGRRGGSAASIPRQRRNVPYGIGAPAAACVAHRPGDVLRGDRVGGPEQEHVGPVGQHHQGEHLAGGGALEQRRQQQSGVGGAGHRRRCR